MLDGPLAFDNAVSEEAARTKKIVSPVAGRADILLVPDLEAGNMVAKQLQYLAGADSAGIVINAGSSSLKFSLFVVRAGELALDVRGQVEGLYTAPRFVAKDPAGRSVAARSWDEGASLGHDGAVEHVRGFLRERLGGDRLIGVGHRVVHGSLEYAAPVRVDDDVLKALRPQEQSALRDHQPARRAGTGLPDLLRTQRHGEPAEGIASRLAMDRTSCERFTANQFQMFLTATAYILFQILRAHTQGTACADAQVSTLRERLFTLAAWVQGSVRRIVLHLPTSPRAGLPAVAARRAASGGRGTGPLSERARG